MAARKKDPGLEPLVLHIGDEAFALTEIQEIDDGDGEKVKVPVPSLKFLEQLSFKEQHAVRRYARELSGNETGTWTDFDFMDIAPALATVVNRRAKADYSLDDALALDWDGLTTRPTKPRS